ncbi:hypothetical protein [Dermacoccus sp. PE3]|uniref:hypothetical protein n=1 Tax=Dermacoccus sp. PE3 TaxID=1641401 RepID=UPI00350F00C2
MAAEGALFYVGDPHHAMGPGEGTHCDGGFPARHLPPVGLQEGVWGCPVGRLPTTPSARPATRGSRSASVTLTAWSAATTPT